MTTHNSAHSRNVRQLTDVERERYAALRAKINEELPDLVARGKLADEANAEQTVSGALRRAIHQSPFTLDELGERAAVDAVQIDEFLTGERTLRSDVLDRIAKALGYNFPAEPIARPAVAAAAATTPLAVSPSPQATHPVGS